MQLLGALPATALHHHTSPLHNEQKEAFLELQDTGGRFWKAICQDVVPQ